MAKKFEITRGNAILNFSEEFCQSRCELVESESFSIFIYMNAMRMISSY